MSVSCGINRQAFFSEKFESITITDCTRDEALSFKRKRNKRVIITASSPPLLRSKDKEIWLTCRWGDLSQT